MVGGDAFIFAASSRAVFATPARAACSILLKVFLRSVSCEGTYLKALSVILTTFASIKFAERNSRCHPRSQFSRLHSTRMCANVLAGNNYIWIRVRTSGKLLVRGVKYRRCLSDKSEAGDSPSFRRTPLQFGAVSRYDLAPLAMAPQDKETQRADRI